MRLGAADDLLLAEGKEGAGKLAPDEGEIPRVGLPRSVDADSVRRDHVPPEHHRLQEEPALVGQHGPDPGEEPAIDILLPPGAVLLRRAEVLEGAGARHGVERPEAIASDLPRVVEADVEVVAPAGGPPERKTR